MKAGPPLAIEVLCYTRRLQGVSTEVLRLEDLLLANLIVRRGFANPLEVQQTLVAFDRAPGRGDLLGALAQRGGALALPQTRDQAIAGVRRFVLQRAESLMVARVRQANVLPPAALEDLVARQRAEGTTWTLTERLAQEGRIDPSRRAALEADAARDLDAYGAQLVARHRASHFAETVALPAPGVPNLATSSEVLRALAPDEAVDQTLRMPPPSPMGHAHVPHGPVGHPQNHALPPGHSSGHYAPAPGHASVGRLTPVPAVAPPAAAASGSDDDVSGEVTLKIPPPPAHLMRASRPLEIADPSALTVALPPPGPGDPRLAHSQANSDDGDGGKTIAFPAPKPSAPPGTPSGVPDDGTVRLGESGRMTPAPKPKKPPGPLAPGAVLADKLEVVDELGRGGMGVVYRARSRPLGREVALKVVPAKGAALTEILPRFKREILTASRVHHENVCEILDHGEAQGLAYMAMELIEGESLRELVDREAPLTSDRALVILEQILRGLAACHDAKVIHRDLKPDNVRISKKGSQVTAKIVDFGIARLSEEDAAGSEDVFVTMKGVLSGTPSYVAPELIMDDALVSAGADVYAVGVIFYELVTGKLPFPAKTLREILKETVETPPTPLRDALPEHTIAPPLERVLFRMLEKDPQVRYRTPGEVLAALEEVKHPKVPEKTGFTARLVKRITQLFGKA